MSIKLKATEKFLGALENAAARALAVRIEALYKELAKIRERDAERLAASRRDQALAEALIAELDELEGGVGDVDTRECA